VSDQPERPGSQQPPAPPTYPQAPPTYPQAPPAYPPAPPAAPPPYVPPAGWGPPPAGPSGWGQAPEPAPGPKRHRGLVAGLAALVVLALLAGAGAWAVTRNGSSDDATAVRADRPTTSVDPSDVGPAPAGASRVVVQGGSPSEPSQRVMQYAIADVDNYWKRTYPKVFGSDYRTVEGGFYAVLDGQQAPCTQSPDDVQNNAFYCPTKDLVAWDADGLVPYMVNTYGSLGLGLVIAHEWGHAIQSRAKIDGPTVFMEQQADCFAGAWVDDARDRGDRTFRVSGNALDQALAGFLELRDAPGSSAGDPTAHGTAFDRIRAFQEGIDGGAKACSNYTVAALSKKLVDIQFTSQSDLESGGNLALQESFDTTLADLRDFWTSAWTEFGGSGTFSPPELTVFPASQRPTCKKPVGLSSQVFYCPATNVLAVQQDGLVARAHDKIGDFALGEILGSGYALSALHQLGKLGGPSPATTRRADCLAGVWSASVFAQNRSTAQLQLSPGDLDEAVAALLATSDQGKGSVTGTGADRVSAYRSGFMNGQGACGL
jgi:predicted metalloprotease